MKFIEIEILLSNSIIDVDADYLILKNANEGLFGPEESVNKASGGLILFHNKSDLTRIGAVKILPRVEGIYAKGVVLVGIGSGFELSYHTISVLCHKAIESIVELDPSTKVIATVSHGVGFGLDRKEVFLTQLLNFKFALEKYEKIFNLDKIIFNEIILENTNRLKVYLEELTSQIDGLVVKKNDKYFLQLGKSSAIANQIASRIREGRYVFVAIPFAPEFENIYDFGIRLPIEENQLQPIRMDKQYFAGSVIEKIKMRIHECILVIADISTSNPNVLYELGFAEGCNKPTIIICRSDEKLPFDVAGMNVIFYNPLLLRELNQSIANALKVLS